MIRILGGVLGAFFLILMNQNAQAFPEMVRYGYVNCNSCHVSLTGGGLLNDYGREIAREKLAIWKSSNDASKEQDFAYGALDNTAFSKYVKLGGDVRSVYYYENNPDFTRAQTIFMQGDLEGAVVTKKITVDGTLGIEQPIPGKDVDFISRRHYLQYSATDEFNIRVGKFFPSYGINTPDHVTLTRAPLRFGVNDESYNLELSYQTDAWSVFLTGIFGRFDDQQSTQDRGFTVQGTVSPTEHMKLGVNYWYGEQPSQTRSVMGPFAMIGITNALYFQSEIDFQFLHPIGQGTANLNGMASTQRISYELFEGLWLFGQQEYGKFDFATQTNPNEDYGVGFQIFPRSHFEFNIFYEKNRYVSQTQGSTFEDFIWFMAHFYI